MRHAAKPTTRKGPPRLAVRLLELTAPGADLDCMLGDLEEELTRRHEESSGRARWWVGPDAYPRGRRQFQILARIADGQTLADVNTELGLVAARTDAQFRSAQPEYEKWRMEARSFVDINVAC